MFRQKVFVGSASELEPAGNLGIKLGVLVRSGPFAFGRGEDETPLIDRRLSFGGGVRDPVGEAPVTEIPGPPLVFGRNGDVKGWLKLRLLPVAVEGRSVIVGVLGVSFWENSGESSIPCKRLNSRQQMSLSFDNILRCPEFNKFELSPDSEGVASQYPEGSVRLILVLACL